MNSLEPLILEGAVRSRKGHFSLALEKAKEKLKRFQLPDPRYYVLQLIQAFAAAGAQRISVVTDTGSLRYELKINFDGPGYTKKELETMTDHLFLSGKERDYDRLRELALGMLSCQALGPDSIGFQSQGYRLNWPSEEVTKAPSNEQYFSFVCRGRAIEADLLSRYCGNCEVPLFLNEKRISASQGEYPSISWPAFHFEQGGLKGSAGLGYADMDKSSLTFLRYGVEFCRRWEENLQPPITVILEADMVRKNASQTDVVEDEAYAECLALLQSLSTEMAASMAGGHIPSYQRQIVHDFLVGSFAQWLDARVLENRDKLPDSARRLLEQRVFIDVKGRYHSIEQLRKSYEAEGYLSLASQMFPYARLDKWVVLCPTPAQLKVLRRLFPRTRFVDGVLRAAIKRGQHASPPMLRQALHDSEFLIYFDAPPDSQVQRLGVLNEHPTGQLSFFFPRPAGLSTVFENYKGWSLAVVMRPGVENGPWRRPALVQVEQDAPRVFDALYEQFLYRLKEMVPRHEQRLAILEHLMSYWWSRLEPLLDEVKIAPLEERVRQARHLLGSVWSEPLWTTQSGGRFSLADLALWFTIEPFAVASFGGQKLVNDHALDLLGSQETFLKRIFGEDRIQLSTANDPRTRERSRQQLLGGCAERDNLAEELEELDRDPEEEKLAKMRQEFRQMVADSQTQPSEAPVQAPALRVTLSTDELEPGEVAESETEAVQEKNDGGPTLEEVRKNTESEGASLAVNRFRRPSLEGILCIPRDGRGGVWRFAAASERGLPVEVGHLDVYGWLRESDPGVDSAQEWEDQLEELYQKLADFLILAPPDGEDFQKGRRALLRYLRSKPIPLERRLASSDDRIARVHFLPTAGKTLASLHCLQSVVEQQSALPACGPDTPDVYPYPVVELGGPVSEGFYEDLYDVEIRWLDKDSMQAQRDRLLQAVRNELQRVGAQPELALSPDLLENICWGEPLHFLQRLWRGYFIHHDPASGVTEINPEHRLIAKVDREVAREDHRSVPILASSVFTAINRALEEVEDHHELAFLEALMEGHHTR